MTPNPQVDGKSIPATMRAVLVREHGAVDTPSVEYIPTPAPGAGEVLIRSAKAGVNFPDRLVIEGSYQVRPQLPFVPGKELVGDVVAVGAGVSGLRVGARVIARLEYGAWAEFACVAAAACSTIPAAIDDEAAMGLGLTYQTAWYALKERAAIANGDHVLVTGAAGGVGLAAIELVAALGGVPIAAVRHPEQHRLVRDHGAAFVIDVSTTTASTRELSDRIKAEVLHITGERGVDIVIDNVGGDLFAASLRTLAWCGTLVVVGFAGGEIPTIKAGHLLVKNISVVGLQWSDYRDREPAGVDAVQQELWKLHMAKSLVPEIMQCYDLKDFAKALNRLAEGHVAGQALLSFD